MNFQNKFQKNKLKKNLLVTEFIEISKEIISLKKNNRYLSIIFRNENYYQIFIILLETYINQMDIHESKISKFLNCSKLTTQKYLLDLYENDIINFELDKVDKRKKNIIFTSNFINELSTFFSIFKNRIDMKGF